MVRSSDLFTESRTTSEKAAQTENFTFSRAMSSFAEIEHLK